MEYLNKAGLDIVAAKINAIQTKLDGIKDACYTHEKHQSINGMVTIATMPSAGGLITKDMVDDLYEAKGFVEKKYNKADLGAYKVQIDDSGRVSATDKLNLSDINDDLWFNGLVTKQGVKNNTYAVTTDKIINPLLVVFNEDSRTIKLEADSDGDYNNRNRTQMPVFFRGTGGIQVYGYGCTNSIYVTIDPDTLPSSILTTTNIPNTISRTTSIISGTLPDILSSLYATPTSKSGQMQLTQASDTYTTHSMPKAIYWFHWMSSAAGTGYLLAISGMQVYGVYVSNKTIQSIRVLNWT